MESANRTSHPTSLSDFFLLAILLFVLIQVGRLLLPLSGAILGALVIAIAFFPFHQRVVDWFPKRSRTTHALLTDILIILILIVPSVLLVWMITNEAEKIAPAVKEWRETFQNLQEGNADAITPLRRIRGWLYNTVGIHPSQFREQLGAIINRMVGVISLGGASLAKHSFAFLLNLVVMVITLFFIFRDSDAMVKKLNRYVPLRPDLKADLADKFKETVRGVVRGWFVTALVQGLVASIGYAIAGIPTVASLGTLTALFGLIPSIGTALVWLPLSAFYLSQHAYFKGFFILGWGLLVVSVIDNLLRPYLVKNRAQLAFLPLFLAIIGGVEIWGTKGVLIGPILVALLWPLLEEYHQRYWGEKRKA